MVTAVKDKFIKKEFLNLVWEILKSVAGIAAIVIIIRFFIFQPFFVVGSSMEPNFHQGEYLLVNQIKYRLGSPQRGEVVVFKYPRDRSRNYIKRIVALPNETIEVKNGFVKIYNNENSGGFILKEPYLLKNGATLGNIKEKLASDEYFVLGDNREPNLSSDSREWGSLPRHDIIGKAWLRLWPPAGIGFVPAPSISQ